MAASEYGDRVAVGPLDGGLTFGSLFDQARRACALITAASVRRAAYVAPVGPVLPVALFASAWAGIPFVPLSYRLAADQLGRLLSEQQPVLVIAEHEAAAVARAAGYPVVEPKDWLETLRASTQDVPQPRSDENEIAALLYTSGTTAAPKAAILRHRDDANDPRHEDADPADGLAQLEIRNVEQLIGLRS